MDKKVAFLIVALFSITLILVGIGFQRESTINTISAELIEKDSAIQEYKTALNERDSAIQEYKTALNERDSAIQEYKTALYKTALNERDSTIQEYKTALNERELVIQELSTRLTEKSEEEKFLLVYLQATNTLGLARIELSQADYYYEIASYDYDYGDFQNVIDNSVMARSYYSDASQEYKNSKALFERANKSASDEYHELVANYIELTNSGSKISICMYEACEYFESAARYYSIGDYTSGDWAIEQMNKKIVEHDEWVNIHNDYLAKINAL